jgi:glycosyltransferase involved in cell wall biosynthesis
MQSPADRPRLTVVSPFLDKRHGTERCVAEQIERLSEIYEIHLYSERVQDVDLRNIKWHRVPMPPGPHLLRYVGWFLANHALRWRDRYFRALVPDVVYSPGVNCLDADVICVHIVFGEFSEQVHEAFKLARSPLKTWPVIVHRRLYYWLIESLERHVYRNERVFLAAVSQKTARAVVKYCGRKGTVKVVYDGLDLQQFNPSRREAMRLAARATLALPDDAVVVLLIGNDWKTKGLPCLLEAASRLRLHGPRLRLLVVGHDTASPYQETIRCFDMSGQVTFLPLRSDVEFYYAAADVYAGPSRDDSFAMPPAEAMACGLPAITTRMAGVSEIITHGEDGLILEDPDDAQTLSEWLGRLATDVDWRNRMGAAAARTAEQYTWEQNALQMRSLFDRAIIARDTA